MWGRASHPTGVDRVGCPKTCKVLLVGSVSCHHNIEQLCHGVGSNPRGSISDGKHEAQVPSSGLNQTQGRMVSPDSAIFFTAYHLC